MKTAWACLLLTMITLAVFANVLGNGFVGDDHGLIVGNDFYRSSNMAQLFSPRYLSTGAGMLSAAGDRGSGSVAFRPLTSLTYFMDRFLWQESPAGYHATSLLIHVLNVLLVYLLLLALQVPGFAAFLGACVFAVHPVQSEPVAAIAYRSDLLVTFFLLLATLAWVRFRSGRGRIWSALAIAAFLGALFSKETAVLWPLWCLFHDRTRGLSWRASRVPVGVLGLLMVGYLGLYFLVFPNTTLGTGGIWAPFAGTWLGIMAHIWGTYVLFFLAPWTVVPLPGVYVPAGLVWWASPWFWLVLVFLAGIVAWWRAASTEERLLLLWAGLFFVPVSGVVFNPNPAACRYLYLPLVGLAGATAVLLARRFPDALAGASRHRAGRALVIGYLAAAVVFTMIDNGYWKNNYTIGTLWVEKFPDFYKGHVVLGVELIHLGKVQEAIAHFEQALKDPRCADPEAWHGLAYAYAATGRTTEARAVLGEIKRLFPGYLSEVAHP